MCACSEQQQLTATHSASHPPHFFLSSSDKVYTQSSSPPPFGFALSLMTLHVTWILTRVRKHYNYCSELLHAQFGKYTLILCSTTRPAKPRKWIMKTIRASARVALSRAWLNVFKWINAAVHYTYILYTQERKKERVKSLLVRDFSNWLLSSLLHFALSAGHYYKPGWSVCARSLLWVYLEHLRWLYTSASLKHIHAQTLATLISRCLCPAVNAHMRVLCNSVRDRILLSAIFVLD